MHARNWQSNRLHASSCRFVLAHTQREILATEFAVQQAIGTKLLDNFDVEQNRAITCLLYTSDAADE